MIQTSEELRIETCLLSVCIVNYAVGRRRDLCKIIEAMLVTHLNSLYTNGTGLIKNRVCMVIQYYCQFLFPEEEQAFKSLLLVILNCCNPSLNNIPSVNIQASETLSYMLQEEEVIVRIYSYIPELITSLTQLVDFQSSKAFFEALQEIITSNTALVLPYLSTLVPSLINKVISETNARRDKKKKTSIIIVKCWNIIRTLIECKNLTNNQI